MKHFIFSSLALALSFVFAASAQTKDTWTLDGKTYEVDTLIYEYQVGPGAKFAKYSLPQFPLKVSMLTLDLQNPYLQYETCLGGQKITGAECPTSMYARNDAPGHDMFAATNGDFYIVTDAPANGTPRSGQLSKGEMVINPMGWASFVLTEDRVPYVDRVDFSGTLTFGSASERIHTVNAQYLEYENTQSGQLTLFTNYYGAETHNCSGGTKVIIAPKSGSFSWGDNCEVEAVVEDIIDGAGVTAIPDGKAILWGFGNSEPMLKSMSKGSEVKISLSSWLRATPSVRNLKEQMGGSNTILLRDGKYCESWEERHPRTIMGYDKSKRYVYVAVIDGRQTGSAGANSNELADILLKFGAWDGVNLDGGGSSCMVINGDIMNTPSDGPERAVGNGNLFYSTAPTDENIASINFAPSSKFIAAGAFMTPDVYGYNQYGLLKNKKLSNVKFSCDPAIGHFDADGRFNASTTPAEGYLYAEFAGIKAQKKMVVMATENSLRLDSVVVDATHPYAIEVITTIGSEQSYINPAVCTWTSDNTDVCVVEDGVIKAVGNGKTTVSGSMLGKEGSIVVNVRNVAQKVLPLEPSKTLDGWTVRNTGGKNHTTTILDNGLKFAFTGTSGRNPNIIVSRSLMADGIPSALRLRINPNGLQISNITISGSGALQKLLNYTYYFTEQPEGLTTIDIPLDNFFDTKDQGQYPFIFNSMKLLIKPTSGTEYSLEIPGIEMVYGDLSGVSAVANDNKSSLSVYPNPAKSGNTMTISGIEEDAKVVYVYNEQGSLVATMPVVENMQIATSSLAKGLYLIATDKSQSAKFIVE